MLHGIFFSTIAFILLMLFSVFMIYRTLARKRAHFHINNRIQTILGPWISRALLEESADSHNARVTAGFLRYLKRKRNRQFAIDHLINSKKNLTGNAAANTVQLYQTLGLEQDSLQKFHSTAWHVKKTGIYELYMMNQAHMQSEILPYTNSRNESIRMEAQTAIIGFLGFEGLNFLGTLTKPLTEWQQIKLLEQLRSLNPIEEIKHLSEWLRSENDSVVLFALKLTEIYRQMHVHNEAVDCLGSKNERLRRQAIKTLATIANESTSTVLVAHYTGETQENKKAILRSLSGIAGESEFVFLAEQLQNTDDNIKLEAAIVIAKSRKDGVQKIEELISVLPKEPYDKIYLHVQNKSLV